MPAKDKEATSKQWLALRARVKRIALVKILDDVYAFHWLCTKALPDDPGCALIEIKVTYETCELLLAFDVEAALAEEQA